MDNLLISYYKIVEKKIKENKIWLINGSLLLLTIISGIYINLFTNSGAMDGFWGIQWNASGELFFMLGFGLIAGISIIKAFISLVIIVFIGIISTFILYLIYGAYKYFLDYSGSSSNLLRLFLLMLMEFIGALVILFLVYPNEPFMSNYSLVKHFFVLILMWFGIVDFMFIGNEVERRKFGKDYKPKKTFHEMDKKIFWAIVELICLGILIYISIYLSNHFEHNVENAKLLIQTSIILAGFGLIAFQSNKGKKEDWFLSWVANLKDVTLLSILSAFLSFGYIIVPKSFILKDNLFNFSAIFLFFAFTLFILFLVFHKNKYVNEIEKGIPKKKTTLTSR